MSYYPLKRILTDPPDLGGTGSVPSVPGAGYYENPLTTITVGGLVSGSTIPPQTLITRVLDVMLNGDVPIIKSLGLNVANLDVTANIVAETLGASTITYDIDWGDGSPVETNCGTTPTHTYATNGDYTVTVTATNSAGSNTKSETITVGTPINYAKGYYGWFAEWDFVTPEPPHAYTDLTSAIILDTVAGGPNTPGSHHSVEMTNDIGAGVGLSTDTSGNKYFDLTITANDPVNCGSHYWCLLKKEGLLLTKTPSVYDPSLDAPYTQGVDWEVYTIQLGGEDYVLVLGLDYVVLNNQGIRIKLL